MGKFCFVLFVGLWGSQSLQAGNETDWLNGTASPVSWVSGRLPGWLDPYTILPCVLSLVAVLKTKGLDAEAGHVAKMVKPLPESQKLKGKSIYLRYSKSYDELMYVGLERDMAGVMVDLFKARSDFQCLSGQNLTDNSLFAAAKESSRSRGFIKELFGVKMEGIQKFQALFSVPKFLTTTKSFVECYLLLEAELPEPTVGSHRVLSGNKRVIVFNTVKPIATFVAMAVEHAVDSLLLWSVHEDAIDASFQSLPNAEVLDVKSPLDGDATPLKVAAVPILPHSMFYILPANDQTVRHKLKDKDPYLYYFYDALLLFWSKNAEKAVLLGEEVPLDRDYVLSYLMGCSKGFEWMQQCIGLDFRVKRIKSVFDNHVQPRDVNGLQDFLADLRAVLVGSIDKVEANHDFSKIRVRYGPQIVLPTICYAYEALILGAPLGVTVSKEFASETVSIRWGDEESC